MIKDNYKSDVKIANLHTAILDVYRLKLAPFITKRVFLPHLPTQLDLPYQLQITLLRHKLKPPQCSLRRNHVLLIVKNLVLYVKYQLLHLLPSLLSLLQNLALLVSILLLVVTVNQIRINRYEQVHRFPFLYQTYQLNHFLQNYLAQLFYRFYFRKFILKFTLVQKILQYRQIKG